MVCSNNYKKIGKVQFPVPFEDDDGKGHMYEIRGVIPNHLQERNYPMSRLQRMLVVETSKDSVTGLFVTEDGLTKLYAKEKTSAKLEPANIKLKVPDVELDSDPYWGIKEPLNFTELDPGVVEKVDPKWYW
jgi:hypothetical protein